MAQSLIKDARKKLEEREAEIASVNEALDSVTDKGRHPPCWYRLVEDKKAINGKRQRDVKIFDVKILDGSTFFDVKRK